MSEPTAKIKVTSAELAAGTIRSVTIESEGTTRVVQVSVPPGTEDGAVLRVFAPGGTEVEVRVTTEKAPEAPADPPATALAPAEAPVSAEAPASTEAPVPAEAVAPAEAPAVAKAPAPAEAFAPAETPVSADTPASAETPVPAEPAPSAEGTAPAETALPQPDQLAYPVPEPPALLPPPPGWATPPAGLPQPAYGQPAYGQPAYGQPGYGQSPYGPQPFGPSDRSRRKIVLFTGIAAAIVVLVVALITANASGSSTSTTSSPSQQALPPAPSTTTQPPESAADYQQALNTLATALNNGLAELNNAQTPAAISTAITDLTNSVGQAKSAFGNNPPANAAAANTSLTTALQTIDTDLSLVGSAATSDQVCLGSAATSLLSRQTSIDGLRTAISTLTDGSGGNRYQFGATLPAYAEDADRAGTNGTIVAGGVKHGLGELTITNSGDTDATVALVKGQGAPLVTVYMGHGGSYTLHHVPDGTYTVYVTSGEDWDTGARLFSRNCDFQQFDQTMNFKTTSTQYTTYTITLTPVAGGDATLSQVDPGAFPH